MKKIKYSDNDWLSCPQCKGDYLHQQTVEYFDRKEDAKTGLHIKLTYGIDSNTVVDEDQTNNPSERREGLGINFFCEHCEVEYKLCIAQHKGNTHIYWK